MKATTPQQFRASVESRLSAEASATGRSINRVRTLLVMERFLTRMVAPDAFVLKGGLALELRLARARTTRDVDVLARGDGDAAEALTRRAAALVPEPADHLEFAAAPNAGDPEIDGDVASSSATRLSWTASLNGSSDRTAGSRRRRAGRGSPYPPLSATPHMMFRALRALSTKPPSSNSATSRASSLRARCRPGSGRSPRNGSEACTRP